MSDGFTSPLRRVARAGRTAGSGLAVVAALLLASPGVHVVRAETPAATVPLVSGEGPMCRAEGIRTRAARRAGLAEYVEARLRAGVDDPRKGVALNGRGYNYPSGQHPWLELQGVELEALLRQKRHE